MDFFVHWFPSANEDVQWCIKLINYKNFRHYRDKDQFILDKFIYQYTKYIQSKARK